MADTTPTLLHGTHRKNEFLTRNPKDARLDSLLKKRIAESCESGNTSHLVPLPVRSGHGTNSSKMENAISRMITHSRISNRRVAA